jgi:hypothetical protein
MSQRQQQEEVNYVKAAFQWQYNLIALGGAAATSLVTMNPLPLILAAGVELMYMATVPNMARFQRLVRSRQYEDGKKQHDEALKNVLYALPAERRERYQQLQQISQTIRSNLARLSSTSQIFVSQLDERLNSLLAAFVRLANHGVQHSQYLQTTNADSIRREISSLQTRLPKDLPRVQEVNKKRIEILEKRLEKFGKIQENCQVIEAQSRAIEDVLQLIREQSMTMEDPQQVSERLDTLVRDVESTEDAVRQMEGIFQMSPEIENSFDSTDSGGNRGRITN